MSDRTVVVRLMAEVGQYQQQMAAAGRATDRLATQTKKTERMISTTLGSIRGMITTFGVPLIGASLVKSFMDFEQQMARVKAVGDPFGASTIGAGKMRDAALEAGQAYGFTASEVGLAMEELAKAGVKTDQILGGVLDSALTLAAAGSIGLADAAKHIAVIQSQFELKGLEAPTRIADQLARAANATVSGVNEMATSLSYVGPIAHGMGMSLEDTVATISLFNQAGLDADMAGTTLRGLLTSLTSPSHLAAMEMAGLNLQLYNADGRMKNVYEIADELKSSMEGLSDSEKAYAIGKIASNAQLQGMLILMKGGGGSIDKMRKLILAQASAEEVAKAKTASFTGEVKKLGAAIESSAIKTMQKLIPVMEPIVIHLKDATNWFGNLGGGAQLAAVGLAAQLIMARRVSSGMGGFSAAINKAKQETVTYRQALDALERRKTFDVPTRQFSQVTDNLKRTVTELERSREEIGRVKVAWGEMRSSVDAAGSTTERAAARFKGSMGIMRGGAENLMSFLGGPWGVAITGAIILLGVWAAKHAETKRRQEELTEKLGDLADSYRKFGSTTSEAAQELIKKDKTLRELATHTKEYGVTIAQLTKASAGEADAQREVIRLLKERRIEAMRAQSSPIDIFKVVPGGLMSFFAKRKQEGITEEYDNLLKSLEAQFQLQKDIAKITKEQTDIGLMEYWNRAGTAIGEVNPLMKQLWENSNILASEQANAADKSAALKNSLDLLHGSLNSVSDAIGAVNSQSLRDVFMEKIPAKPAEPGKAAEEAVYEMKKTKAHYERTYTGKKDVKGKKLYTEKFVPEKTERVLKKAGKAAEAGQAAVAEHWINKFDPKMIDAWDGKFKKLIKTNGVLNEEMTQLSIKFNAAMSERSRRILDAVEVSFTQAKASGRSFGEAALIAGYQFAGLREEAIQALIPIVGNRKEAEKLVKAYIPLPPSIATTFAQPGMEKALEDAGKLGLSIHQIPGQKDVYISADTEKGLAKLEHMGFKIEKLPDGSFGVHFANWAEVESKFAYVERAREVDVKFRLPKKDDAIQRSLEMQFEVAKQSVAIDAGDVTVRGGKIDVHGSGGSPKPSPNPVPGRGRRWGGIDAYAAGGLREAKIASAGPPIYQWAEKETGGEAFIPRLGNAARSLSILEQAASWYGQAVVPAGRMPAAAGAVRPVAPLTSQQAGGTAAPAPVTQVRVFLGNEELTSRVRVQIEQASAQSALQASWGRRA